MKRFRSAFLLLVAGCLAFSMAACGGGDKTSTTGSKSSDESTASGERKIDFGGKTVKIGAWADISPKLSVSDGGDAQYNAMKWVEDKYNCKIEFVITPEQTYFETFVQESLSGSAYVDIALLHCWNYLTWINDGLIQKVTDLYTDGDEEHWDLGLVSFKDDYWGVSPLNKNKLLQSWMAYNPKMISDLNLEDPQALAKKGEWTWAKFREYCQAATTLGEGYYGVHSADFAENMLHSNNILPYAFDGTKYVNAYTYDSTQERMLHLLELMSDMKFKDKSLLGESPGGLFGQDEMLEAFNDGKLMFSLANVTYAKNWKDDGMTNYAPINYPVGPDMEEKLDYIMGYSFLGIPKYTNYAREDLFQLMKDYYTTWDESRGDAYYVPDRDQTIDDLYNQYFVKREDAEFLLGISEGYRSIATYTTGLNIGDITYNQIYVPILTNEKTPAAVLAESDNLLQEKINEILN